MLTRSRRQPWRPSRRVRRESFVVAERGFCSHLRLAARRDCTERDPIGSCADFRRSAQSRHSDRGATRLGRNASQGSARCHFRGDGDQAVSALPAAWSPKLPGSGNGRTAASQTSGKGCRIRGKRCRLTLTGRIKRKGRSRGAKQLATPAIGVHQAAHEPPRRRRCRRKNRTRPST
jgi:hypothetical protein